MNWPSRDLLFHRWLRMPYLLHVRQGAQPRRARLTVVFLHGIGSNGDLWQPLIETLPSSVRSISLDLLGFGDSPKPAWPTYDAGVQARSVIATLVRCGLTGPVVIVGHSLGSLVAVEIAKRYQFLVKSLILCSPPFYSQSHPSLQEKLLQKLYQAALKYPQLTLTITKLGSKYPVVNTGFKVDEETIGTFLATLESSVVNQTALDDLGDLHMPIELICGRMDPLVPPHNLVMLSQTASNLSIHWLVASHEVTAAYSKVIGRLLDQQIRGKVNRG